MLNQLRSLVVMTFWSHARLRDSTDIDLMRLYDEGFRSPVGGIRVTRGCETDRAW
jgi:hypothetical protein